MKNMCRVFLALAALLACSGCSSKDPDQPKEVPSSEAVNLDASQEELFETAQKLFRKGLYSVALDSYTALRNGYPVGPYAEYAELKIGDCAFGAGNYTAAAQSFESFSKDHPASPHEPYALFMAGRSYQLASRGVGRDSAPLSRAVEFYDKLLDRYPTSPYSAAAAVYRRETLTDLARHEEMVLEFYRRQNKTEAAAARQDEFNQRWAVYLNQETEPPPTMMAAQPRSDAAGEMMARPALEAPELAAAVRAAPLEPRTEGLPREAATTKRDAGGLNIECRSKPTPWITITLSSEEDLLNAARQFVSNPLLKPDRGKITLQLPSTPGRRIALNCFATNDLEVSSDGLLSLASQVPATAATLAHPPRLMLIMRDS